jgi:serine/threonine protein kinase
MHHDETVTALPDDVQVGRQFGVYRVEGLLGAGGMGYVFRGVDTRLNRPVAIKVCAARFGERFDREARAISAFNHPHVCTLYDIGPNYLVMELIDGETLSAHIGKGPLPIDDVLRYGAQIADALTEAHRAGIVHRDLKPGNVMISRHGVKVLDFGLAKMTEAGEPTITRPFTVLGTPAYMAPEQIAGRHEDARSDLFALGLILYEMTTGQLPLPGVSLGSALQSGGHAVITPASKIRTEASPALDNLIARLLSADPARRPASAVDVATAPPCWLAQPRLSRWLWSRHGGSWVEHASPFDSRSRVSTESPISRGESWIRRFLQMARRSHLRGAVRTARVPASTCSISTGKLSCRAGSRSQRSTTRPRRGHRTDPRSPSSVDDRQPPTSCSSCQPKAARNKRSAMSGNPIRLRLRVVHCWPGRRTAVRS